MKIPWENSISVWMCFFLFLSPSGKNYYFFFFLFNKYTHIIYTYELHLKLFNKITTLKKPHTFPRESRKTDRPCSHKPKYCQIHRIAQNQNKENSRRWATCGKPLISFFFFSMRANTSKSQRQECQYFMKQNKTSPDSTGASHGASKPQHCAGQRTNTFENQKHKALWKTCFDDLGP